MPIIGIQASAISGNLWPANSYESIATATVGAGGSASIVFSSIPATYKHLQIRCIARLSGASYNSIFRPNGDSSTASYTYHSLYADGTTTTADAYTTGLSGAYSLFSTSSAQGANTFGVGVIDVLDYTSTNKYKTFRSFQGWDNNGSGFLFLSSSLWKDTSVISSLTIVPEAGSFVQYSQFALYGIKGA